MFSEDEIHQIVNDKQFQADYSWVQQNLLNKSLSHKFIPDDKAIDRLDYFVESAIASCPYWEAGTLLSRYAAELAEVLSVYPDFSTEERRKNRIRSAILYEYAGMPSLSNAVLEKEDLSPFLISFFKREKEFQKLNENGNQVRIGSNENTENEIDIPNEILQLDVLNLINYQQGYLESPQEYVSALLVELSKALTFNFNSSEINSISELIRKRLDFSTKSNVSDDLFPKLKSIRFPVELWPAQVNAVKNGMLNSEYDSWGLASPTGTGKTFLTRLLVADALDKEPESKILYVVPSRALVYEVSQSLGASLENLGINVLMINPMLSDLDSDEEQEIENSSVIVLTPEKADLLARIGKGNLQEVSHVIIDEAHHIESSTRGVLLELYLWRIKRLIKRDFRFIFLSAVAPNIDDLASWGGKNPKSSIVVDRATRMRAGVFKPVKNVAKTTNEGWIHFSDGSEVCLIDSNLDVSGVRKTLVHLVEELHQTGPVLVVAKGKKECEKLAETLLDRQQKEETAKNLSDEELSSEYFQRVDSRLEREMYNDVPLRQFIKNRIAYHHAGLPPRVRMALEDLIRKGFIDFVFATTTLAEGVNFPFSSVVVQSLVFREAPQAGIKEARYKPITPRSFWNIAGRAGRPGFDIEGQVILFEPTLGLDKVNTVLSNYLNPNLKDIDHVRSGLFQSIKDLYKSAQDEEFDLEALKRIELDETLPRDVKGTINLLRVGLVHAQATEILASPEEIVEGSFAFSFFSKDQIDFSKKLINEQSEIVNDFFKSEGAPSEKIVAEMGLSLDTLERLKNYVQRLEDWQIRNLTKMFYGGVLNLSQAAYTIGPVSKNMAELEGPRLGGFVSELAINWLSGVPLTIVRSRTSNYSGSSVEELISVIYSRIQYLLPWGLFAVDGILEDEAKKRSINYNGEVKKLSFLVDAGVPSFDAFRLVNLDFERVDATRLGSAYRNSGGRNLGIDIIDWVTTIDRSLLNEILKGSDDRRIDYDLDKIISMTR